MNANILIVDDEAGIRKLVSGILEDEGYECRSAGTMQDALEAFEAKTPDLVLLDIWLQDGKDEGLELLNIFHDKAPHLPIIMISGHGTIETAVGAIKAGAYDFIEKPFRADRLCVMVARAIETAFLKDENSSLRRKIDHDRQSTLVGSHCISGNLKTQVEKISNSLARVFISGESGTGKETLARHIHQQSSRSEGPFVVLNCAALHPDTLERFLFGIDDQRHVASGGLFDRADGGTLYFDEITDLHPEVQAQMIRILKDSQIKKPPPHDNRIFDIRIIAASSRNMGRLIDTGMFRKDLFYRLNVISLEVQPLRERPQDIPELALYFAEDIAEKTGLAACTFNEQALLALQNHRWPGNIRQLRNAVEGIMILSSAHNNPSYIVTAEDLVPVLQDIDDEAHKSGFDLSTNAAMLNMSLREAREAFEKEYLSNQIMRFGGNISKTARFVGMERSALHRKLKSLDIDLAGPGQPTLADQGATHSDFSNPHTAMQASSCA